MSIVLEALDRGEQNWRKIVKAEYPLFSNIPVKKAKPNPKSKRHWMFYTDNDTVYMDIHKPEEVERIFRESIQKMYRQAYGMDVSPGDDLVKRLLHDNFVYLHFHELFHPLYCPNSKEDEKRVDEAIYKGIMQAEPGLSKKQAVLKVGHSRNACWDQIIDSGFFYLSNYGNSLEGRINHVLTQSGIQLPEVPHLPDAVVPIFDITELEVFKEDFESMFYPLTRALYGLLFTREPQLRGAIFDYFKQRITKQMKADEFDKVMVQALKGFGTELSAAQWYFLQSERGEFEHDVTMLYKNYATDSDHHASLIKQLAIMLLDKQTRYDAIRGFIKPLSKYISLAKEEKRHGTHILAGIPMSGDDPENGEGTESGGGQDGQPTVNQPGGNAEQALTNLADILNNLDANDLLSGVANDTQPTPKPGNKGGPARSDARLIELATDEYYKRNAKEAIIRSPDYEAVTIQLGTRKIPVYVGSQNVAAQDIHNLPIERILKFQQDTGIVQLIKISDYEYRYDQYEWEEIPDTDYCFDTTGLIMPDTIVLHVDSSSSMGPPKFVGTGSKYDVLMRICYSTLKTLRKASEEMRKEVYVINVNFGDVTLISKPQLLSHMMDTPHNEGKRILTGFQYGGTVYSPLAFDTIRKSRPNGKMVHLFVTDGDLSTFCIEPTIKKIREEVARPQTAFLYFEIGCSTGIGKEMQKIKEEFPNLQYHPNITIQDVQSKALEVLLNYDNGRYNQLV